MTTCNKNMHVVHNNSPNCDCGEAENKHPDFCKVCYHYKSVRPILGGKQYILKVDCSCTCHKEK